MVVENAVAPRRQLPANSGLPNVALSREFFLLAACCRWPLSATAIDAIRLAAAEPLDWAAFLRLAHRHRVLGFVHQALVAAGTPPPPEIAQQLAAAAQQIANFNLTVAGETIRLIKLLEERGIPVLVLKGVALANRVYGSLGFKQGKDIDLLVPAERAIEALRLLEHEGYVVFEPADDLPAAALPGILDLGTVFGLGHRDRKSYVDLCWRLTSNPMLLVGIDAASPVQTVQLAPGRQVSTLQDDDLAAYLCVHGAGHDWSRIKWLADFNALVGQKCAAEIERLYRHAQDRGAGLCAAQGLALCERLFDLSLPPRLHDEFARSRRVERLVAVALEALAGPGPGHDRGFLGTMRWGYHQFLLGSGLAFVLTECRVMSISLFDVIRVPLPRPLYGLYPILRLPLWLWRRLASRWTANP